MKTDWEKAAEKVAKTVKEVLLRNFDDEFFKKADVMAAVCFKVLSDLLKKKRVKMNEDFKAFCKSHKFTQYKIRDIEQGRMQDIDPDLFAKYVKAINAEAELKEWISKFPNVAKRYKLI